MLLKLMGFDRLHIGVADIWCFVNEFVAVVVFVCLRGGDLCGQKDYNRYALIILHKLADIYCYCILL